MSFYLLVELDR